MAAILRHSVCRSSEILLPTTTLIRHYATKAEKKKGIDRKPTPTINSTAESLSAKGFLRPQRNYTPPKDVDQSLNEIFTDIFGKEFNNIILDDIPKKSTLLNACYKKFQHSVPNSLLRWVNSLEDVRRFYRTRVDATTPLDKMKTMDLPENLHVQYDYHRFHPDTDTKFGGQTAFNRRSTIVTGLKYKDKYPGHTQNTTWPFNS
ncbi:hypothetical protein WA026_001343 [Henosepilachna vigintioctopunctata]|uniref:Large ribosomal subunit protein mL50 n=1 Tax=Henosepilachna vigintioctopunctata TaxID=420089 RepID=A0AAW1UT58_9CUCU